MAEEFGDFMRLGEAEKGPGWKERLAEQQAEKGRLARLEKESVGGRRVIDAEPASAEAMTELSKQFNAQLSDPTVFPGGADVGWFKLFLLVDTDGSGMITWAEFETMVREKLKLSTSKIPDAELESMWAALDTDKGGFVMAEEFGDFMRLGEAEKGPGWKERLAEQQAEKGRLARMEKESVGGRRVIDAEPASAEAMTELSKQFNAQLADPVLFPEGAEGAWFKLFTRLDRDGSGNVIFTEFEGAVRELLGLTPAMLPQAELEAAWSALDQDKSGFALTDEFSAMMRLAAPPKEEAQET